MILAFTLSMPGCNSWNGRWSGDGRKYVRVIDFGRSKASTERAQSILLRRSYHYNFGDGWAASVMVTEVEAKQARTLRKESSGFCGYDWMIDEIRYSGRIKTLAERRERRTA